MYCSDLKQELLTEQIHDTKMKIVNIFAFGRKLDYVSNVLFDIFNDYICGWLIHQPQPIGQFMLFLQHLLLFSYLTCSLIQCYRVLAGPKRQGAAPCRFVQRPVVFPQRPVVFSAPYHFPRALWFLWAFISVLLSLKLQKASN